MCDTQEAWLHITVVRGSGRRDNMNTYKPADKESNLSRAIKRLRSHPLSFRFVYACVRFEVGLYEVFGHLSCVFSAVKHASCQYLCWKTALKVTFDCTDPVLGLLKRAGENILNIRTLFIFG